MKNNFLILGSLLLTQIISLNCYGDIAIVAGYSQIDTSSSNYPSYPLADSFNLYGGAAVSIGVPSENQGIITCTGINPYTGTVLCGGYYEVQNSILPFIYRGSVVGDLVSSIEIPSNPIALINCVAIAPNGTAVFGGFNANNLPVIFTLSSEASEVTLVNFPNSSEAQITAVAIDSNGRAIFVGQMQGDLPIIYSLESGASEATLVTLPNANTGFINCIAIGSDGTAILGGKDTSIGSGVALIYSILQGSNDATLITTANSNDNSIINGVAIGPDGTAILVGSICSAPIYPLIYRVFSSSTSAQIINNPNADSGYLNSVAIGSDKIAIMGGTTPDSSGVPMVYKLFPGDEAATSIIWPNSEEGVINSIAIGSQNIAVLGGAFWTSNQILVYTLPTSSGVPELVSVPALGLEGEIQIVAIYSSSDELYDIRRLRPYYYLQKDETSAKLNQ